MKPTRQPSSPRRPRARRLAAFALISTVVAPIITMTIPAQAAPSETLAVDFSASTGEFRGGASGMLYGLSDDGVPTDAILAGARPLSVTQKAPHGAQHPNGDPLEVEDAFFRNGGEYILTNIQDYYPDWPYNGGQRPDDFQSYLDIVTTVVTSIRDESAYPEKYIFVPFNEPDGGNWYFDWATMKDTFLADWKAVYETIKAVDPDARIAGLGDTSWQPQRTKDFLTFAKANDVLPDMFTWHELGINNLATFRGHHQDYRAIERDLEIAPLPINITEYAMRRDMSVPGQLVQWLALFEDAKVDAQTAYWTYAGNLNDNMAKTNAANGAWWLLAWYADLAGDTVRVTPPALNKVDTLQGTAAVDTNARQGTVLFGGSVQDVVLDLSGLDPTMFGELVDVQVREAQWSGQEGEAFAPPVVVAERVKVVDGAVSIVVPGGDPLSAYQAVVTPALATIPIVDTTFRASIEAEDTTLRDVTAYSQPMSNDWLFAASGQRDVGSTNRVTSSLTWDVEVPHDGTYVFGSVAGVNGPAIGPGQHALFVDGEFATMIDYEPGFSWGYRGRTEVELELAAGTHSISVRMSKDGSTLLPGSDISLDKFDLVAIEGVDSHTYPALLSRTDGEVLSGDSKTAGDVLLDGSDSSTFFVAVRETGYHDLTVHYRADAGSGLSIEVNGREVAANQADQSGLWTTTSRVHMAQGISAVRVAVVGSSVVLTDLDVTRARDGDAVVVRTEAEDSSRVTLTGGARVEDVAGPTNVSGKQVGWIGGDAASAAVLQRPEGFGPGEYNMVVRYANADKNSGHAYNTDVITRFMDVTEEGTAPEMRAATGTRAAFRHNYSWKGFWSHTVPVELSTAGGGLVLSNASGAAPNLDWLELAPLVLDVTSDHAAEITLVGLDITPPTTVTVVQGNEMDLSGLEVWARYSDGRVERVAASDVEITGFDPAALGKQTITLTARIGEELATGTFAVTVVAAPTAGPPPADEPGEAPETSSPGVVPGTSSPGAGTGADATSPVVTGDGVLATTGASAARIAVVALALLVAGAGALGIRRMRRS